MGRPGEIGGDDRDDSSPASAAREEEFRLFVPGRVCLLGEHSDWAGEHRATDPGVAPGTAIISGTSQGIHARIARHPDSLVLRSRATTGERFGPRSLPMERSALRAEARAGGFWSYLAGTALECVERGVTGGLVIDNDRTDLPIRKGLSSSAAACVLAARAFNRAYELGWSLREEMEIAYRGETRTPSRCGRMDQACALGRSVVLMTFDAGHAEAEIIPVPRPIHLLVVDLHAGKDTPLILESLQRGFMAEAGTSKGLRHLLGSLNQEFVRRGAVALRQGDAEGLGAVMVEAQEAFDRFARPFWPKELDAPALHRLLEDPRLRALTWGGKGVGSQGDGAAQFVARGARECAGAEEMIREELGLSSFTVTVGSSPPVRPSNQENQT